MTIEVAQQIDANSRTVNSNEAFLLESTWTFAAATTGFAAFKNAADWFFEKSEARLNMTLHYTMEPVVGLKKKNPAPSEIFLIRICRSR